MDPTPALSKAENAFTEIVIVLSKMFEHADAKRLEYIARGNKIYYTCNGLHSESYDSNLGNFSIGKRGKNELNSEHQSIHFQTCCMLPGFVIGASNYA